MERELISLLRPSSEQLQQFLPRGCQRPQGSQPNPAPSGELLKYVLHCRIKHRISVKVKLPQFSVSLNPELGKYIIMEF